MLEKRIREQISRKLEEDNRSLRSVASKSGFTAEMLSSFLLGKTNSMKLSNLVSISKTLGISLEEMLGLQTINKNQNTLLSIPLYDSIVDIIKDHIKNENKQISFENFLEIISDAYNYSIDSDAKQPDKNFINWLIKKY